MARRAILPLIVWLRGVRITGGIACGALAALACASGRPTETRRDASVDSGTSVGMTDAATDRAEPPTPDSGDAHADAAPALDADCTRCLEDTCALPLRVCRADQGCTALLACRAAPTAGCREAFTCTGAATSYAEARGCVAGIAGDGGAYGYYAALDQCASACASRCPPAPWTTEAVATCRSWFETAYPALVTACPASQECLCTRCGGAMDRCSVDAQCTQFLGCLVGSGCDGVECWTQCHPSEDGAASPTEASAWIQDCLVRECAPCAPAPGIP